MSCNIDEKPKYISFTCVIPDKSVHQSVGNSTTNITCQDLSGALVRTHKSRDLNFNFTSLHHLYFPTLQVVLWKLFFSLFSRNITCCYSEKQESWFQYNKDDDIITDQHFHWTESEAVKLCAASVTRWEIRDAVYTTNRFYVVPRTRTVDVTRRGQVSLINLMPTAGRKMEWRMSDNINAA